MLKRITSKKRMRAKLHEVKAECRRRMHLPIPEQGRWLGAVVRGHLAYYAVPGNIAAVEAFRDQATRHWYTALRRRGQKHGRLNWERMHRRAQRWLPPARITHPGLTRGSTFASKPGAQCLNAHAGICAGGGPSPQKRRPVPTATGRLPNSEGGPRKRSGGNAASAPRADPTLPSAPSIRCAAMSRTRTSARTHPRGAG